MEFLLKIVFHLICMKEPSKDCYLTLITMVCINSVLIEMPSKLDIGHPYVENSNQYFANLSSESIKK